MSSVVRTTTGMTRIASDSRAGDAGEVPHARDEDLIDEQADDDRRRAEQDVVDEADDDRDLRVAAVFRHVGAGEHADRRADRDADRRS